MRKLLKKKLNKKGFTLIELIVVIAIVAILAIVGIPAIAGQVAKAKLAALDSNARTLATSASLMITNLEVKGTAAGTILTTVSSGAANVASEPTPGLYSAAGVDSGKFTAKITLVGVNKEGEIIGTTGVTDTTIISYAVDTISITDKGKDPTKDPTGKWSRTATVTPPAGGGGTGG